MTTLETNLELPTTDDPDNASGTCCVKCFIQSVLAVFWQIRSAPANDSDWWLAKFGVALVMSFLHFGLMALVPIFTAETTIHLGVQFATAALTQILIGLPIYGMVLQEFQIQKSKALVGLAALLSFVVPFLVFFIAPSKATIADYQVIHLAPLLFIFLTYVLSIEKNALAYAKSGMAYLESLRVDMAYQETNGQIIQVATKDLKPGDTIKVFAGELIPRDGVILKGTTSVDESDLTGEFVPLLKEKGKTVVGGSYNRDSDITISINESREKDILECMIRKTESALKETTPCYEQAKRTTATILNVGFLAATICFSWHYFYGSTTLLGALSPALAILVSLPWSLFVLTELSIKGLMGAALERGILFTRGAGVTTLSQLKSIFFNKTGTLTLGDFTYSQTFVEPGTNLGECLSVAFSLEAYSTHPLAKAMQTHPWYIEIAKHPVNSVQNHPGLGISGYLAPRGYPSFFVACGNLRHMKRLRFYISKDMKAKIDDLEEMGETVVLCGYETKTRSGSHTRVERQVHCILSFSDTTRKETRSTLRRLQRIAIETALITGDTEKTVTQLTGTLGIKKIHSRCTPEEKKSKIAKEKESGAKVGLVETDVTNNPALEEADLSISIATGTAILDHPSDVLILGSDFSLISWLLQTAKSLARINRIAERVGITLTTLVTFGAFMGFAPPAVALLLPATTSIVALKAMLKEI